MVLLKMKYMLNNPPGFVDPAYPDFIFKLDKALYGLK